MADETILLRGILTLYKESRCWRIVCWPTAIDARNHARKLLSLGHVDHVFIAHLPATRVSAAEFFLGLGLKKG